MCIFVARYRVPSIYGQKNVHKRPKTPIVYMHKYVQTSYSRVPLCCNDCGAVAHSIRG